MVSDVSPRRAVDRGMESCKENRAILVPLRGPALLDHLGPPFLPQTSLPLQWACVLPKQQTGLPREGLEQPRGASGCKVRGAGAPQP